MGIYIDASCHCDICGDFVHNDDAYVLCEDCYVKKVDMGLGEGYHLVANGQLYCHEQKSSITIREGDDRIIFCPFCGERMVR